MIDGSCYQWHGNHGPVIVLIHGLGLNKEMWQWQIPALRKQFRVLTYDLYGHGQSPVTDQQPSLRLFARQIVSILNELHIDRCAVAGFSLGGMIARRFAMDYAERIDALAILNSAHTRTATQQQAIMERVEHVAVHGASATVNAAIRRWFTDHFCRSNPDVIDMIRQWVLANDPDIYAKNYRVLATGVDELVAPNPPISCPTLVVTSQNDSGQTAGMAYAISAEIANAQTRIVPGLRHMGLVESPAQYNELLQSFFEQNIPN